MMVVDDERLCLNELVYMLSLFSGVEISGAFTNPVEALEAAKHAMPDLLFLDLAMPKMHGAELAKRIIEINPSARLVFVTAHVKELECTRNIPAFGSLLKPVSDKRLNELMERFKAIT